MADTIDKLSAMDDAGLGEALGHKQELAKFKGILEDVKKLPANERKKIAATIDSQLKPHVHASGLQYQVEDALARSAAKGAKGKTTPSSLISDANPIDD